MAKAKRNSKQKSVKQRQPVVRRVSKTSKPINLKTKRLTKLQKLEAENKRLRAEQRKAKRLEAENKRLRAEQRKAKKQHKSQAAIIKHQKVLADKINKLGGVKGIKRIIKRRKEIQHRHQVRKHRKEIIAKVREIVEYDEYGDSPYENLEDYERDELLEQVREDYDLDLEDWLDIMFEEGYTEHEAYELWYGYS